MEDNITQKLNDLINCDKSLSFLLDENKKYIIEDNIESESLNLLQKLILESGNDTIKSFLIINIIYFKNDINKKTEMYYYTPLMLACIMSDYDIVKILLKNGSNINEKNIFGDYALLIACRYSKYNSNFKIIKLLIKYNSLLYNNNCYGTFPLLECCYNFNYKIVELLLKNNANPNMYDLDCITPLMIACEYSDYESIKILVKYGAKINAAKNYTIFMYSLFNPSIKIIKFLIKKEVKINRKSYNDGRVLNELCVYFRYCENIKTTKVLKLLLEYNISTKNKGFNSMMYLCKYQTKNSIYQHLNLLLDYDQSTPNNIRRCLKILQKHNPNQKESIMLLKSRLGIKKLF